MPSLKKTINKQKKNDRQIEKKLEKRDRLKTAALKLFQSRGFGETAIDDIVHESDVAKGTFYLYFRNKEEILSEVVIDKSREILAQTYNEIAPSFSEEGSVDALLAFIHGLIARLEADKPLLEVIRKNLSWGFFQRIVEESDHDDMLKRLKGYFEDCVRSSSDPGRDAAKTLFLIIELTSSICYSAIVRGEPGPMAEMEPLLLDSVRRIIA
jgi:AcrR family transcriptional regulator